MDDQGIGLAREALKQIQLFWCLDDTDIEVRRLGGLTNLVFFVSLNGEQYVLRIPGKGTEEYINRKNEAHAAREAAKAGVSPDVVHFDEKTGVMVTRFVDHGVTMSPEHFKTREGAPKRAGEAFKKLHSSGAKFNFRFELFAMIDDYLKILATKDISLPDGYAEVVKEAESVRKALNAHPLPLVACHCDPLCENFLDTGKRMWIVDWEYSGMNDPLWDLGDLAVEGQFSTAQEEEMIAAYFDGVPTRSGARALRDLQGDVRFAVDAVGPDPACQQESGGRFLGLFNQPVRALQKADGHGEIRSPRQSRGRGQEKIAAELTPCRLPFNYFKTPEALAAWAAR